MALDEIPRYEQGVTLTVEEGLWYVLTDAFHPYGAGVAEFKSHADAYRDWTEAVKRA